MVSAELAVSIVTLLLVLSVLLGVLRTGMDRAAAVSVAGAVAREAARDGAVPPLWGRLREGLPPGSSLSLRESGGLVHATVRIPAASGLVRLVLPDGVQVEALAHREGP
jgi:hypothetical protein